MKKKQVLRYFGSVKATGHALDITTQAVQKWPDELSQQTEARVCMLIIRRDGFPIAKREFPKSFELAG